MAQEESRRVIALDLGDVRMGVAVSDPTGTIAQPLEVYRRVGYGPDAQYVLSLARRFETRRIVLGLPLNMDGTQGGQAGKVRAFGEVLAGLDLMVHYQDERMTTLTAERALLRGQMRREDRRETVDKVAAAVILEQWLAAAAHYMPSPEGGKEDTMEQDRDDIIQLQDDQGNDVDFEHLMTLEHNGSYYVVLEAMQDMEDCMQGESIILKIVQDENGEDSYVTIEDEDELQAVLDKCIAAMEEEDSAQEDFPEDEDEDGDSGDE